MVYRCTLQLAGILLLCISSALAHRIEVNITVPEFGVDQEDAYLCVSAVIPPHPHKLVGVIPHARQEVVHHILLYGCREPHMSPTADGQPAVWRCDMQPVCNGPSTIFYGWGRNAPDLQLPDGVGYSVGELTGIRFIVAQVHYLAVRPPDDHSGVTLVLKPHAVPYAAGMLTYASRFEIPPGQSSYPVENSCCFKSHQPLTMFAVRVHTHVLGRRVYMTRETWNRSGIETLYSRDPQLPQSFVPSTRHMLWPGDRLTVTCDFDSTSRSTITRAGGTHNDEMCNMYVMVYGKTPYLTMCEGSQADIRDDSPGALPRGATLELDPSPFWKPPLPDGLLPAAAGGGGMVADPRGPYGDATSVTTGPDGSIWVLYRASGVWQSDTFDRSNVITRRQPVPEAVVARLDPDNGTVLARWGGGITYLPHMITVDLAGDVWVVDTGRHQVLKFSPEGTLLMAVGTELTPGSGPQHFCKPTQVAVLRDGSFLVADGYCNTRIVMFDKDGNFIAESEPIQPVVHSLLADECEGLVYAASREAGMVVALHLDPHRRLQLAATYALNVEDLTHGEAWALGFGPYGEQLALMWREGQDARLVNVRFPQQYWLLPGTSRLSPHDFQLGGAPMQLSGAGDRFYAVYLASVGEACDRECGPLRKFVVVPPGVRLPDPQELPVRSDVSDIHPGDAKLLPGGTAVAEQPHHQEEVKKEEEQKQGQGQQQQEQGQEGQEEEGGDAAGVNGADDAGLGAEGGGAMVADDYDEELEGDAVDVADYEAEVAAAEAAKQNEAAAAEAGEQHPATPAAPLEKERFEILVQDKKVVQQSTSLNSWAVGLVLLLAVLMAFSVLRFSNITLAAYLGEGKGAAAGGEGASAAARGGGGAAAKGAAAAAADGPAGGKRWEAAWAATEGLLARMRGGGAGTAAGAGKAAGGAAAREVEAARERERLLRSEV